MPFRFILAALIVVALGLLGWRLIGGNSIPRYDVDVTTAPAGSDYYMLDATIYQMNKQGRLDYRSKVAKTLHYPDGSARLHDIYVHYVTGTRSYWNLTAARGRVPAGSHDLHLTGGVTLHHPQPDGQTAVIQTSNAWVWSQTNTIETQAHVTAQEPGRTVEGDGLHIDINNDTMKLLNNVQARYTP